VPKSHAASTRFGTQPIHKILRERGISFSKFSRDIGLNELHVYKAARGVIAPSPFLKERASAALNLPVDDLFTVAAREALYLPQFASYKNRQGLVR
jgi:transcriptional regulator with XRE-family HTH domain